MPQPVIALLQRMLEKDPAARFQSPTELIQAISVVTEAVASGRRLTEAELQPQRGAAIPHSRPQGLNVPEGLPSVIKRFRLRSMVIAVVGILLIGLLFFVVYRQFLSGRPPGETIHPGKSIAVLPFESLSPNKEDSYFTDGIQEEILNNLARVAQLKVISRTSVRQYRPDTKRDVRQIAQALGVTNVLEGTVRRNVIGSGSPQS